MISVGLFLLAPTRNPLGKLPVASEAARSGSWLDATSARAAQASEVGFWKATGSGLGRLNAVVARDAGTAFVAGNKEKIFIFDWSS